MSDTLLILHVKGTESDTTTLPRHAVQAALSQGQITNSQLIWSTKDNAWKRVSEMPDFEPVENLILHVKGTEAETRELPKPTVRAAISQGQITHSQLIWSPVDNSWKQAREFPDLLPGEHLILHVKGTEAETKELPKRAIRTAISKGEITHSQLIWSPTQNSWKQVRELPDLLPSQKLAPAPVRAPVVQQPRTVEAIIPESPSGPVARAAVAAGALKPKVRVAGSGSVPRPRVAVQAPPKVSVMTQAREAVAPAEASPEKAVAPASQAPQVSVAAAASTAPTPRVKAAATVKPQARMAAAAKAPMVVRAAAAPILVKTTGELSVAEDESFHPLKWVCIVLGVLIFLVVGGNYLLVNMPLGSRMSQTTYSTVPVYAHFGAFLQPNVIVIHIPGSAKITPDNLTSFLSALARSTPDSPLSREPYARVALTSGWTAQYSFSGYAWKQLGDMAQDSEAGRKEFILGQMGDAGGQSILPESTLSEDAQQARRDQAWAEFVAHFTAK